MRKLGIFLNRGDKKPCDPPTRPLEAVKTRLQRGHASKPCFTNRENSNNVLVNVLYYDKAALIFFCMRRMESCAQQFTIFLSLTTKRHEVLFSENFTFLRPRIMEKSHLSPLNGQRAARKSGRDAPFAHVSNARFPLIILQFLPYPLYFTVYNIPLVR